MSTVTLSDWGWLTVILALLAIGALVIVLAARDKRNRSVRFGFFLEQLVNGKKDEEDKDDADPSPPA